MFPFDSNNDFLQVSEQNPLKLPDLLEQSGIDIEQPSPDLKLLLKDLQGNILKSHGRNFSVYLLLRFGDDRQRDSGANKTKDVVRNYIAEFSKLYITSALDQHRQTQKYKQNLLSGLDTSASVTSTDEIFVNFYISSNGYKFLSRGNEYSKFFDPHQLVLDPNDMIFGRGMAYLDGTDKTNELMDYVDKFDRAYQEKIDALIVLASDDPKMLADRALVVIQELARNSIQIVKREVGFVRKNKNLERIEPFGFIDGISQPLFCKQDIEQVEQSEGISDWNPSAKLKLVLREDPFGKLNVIKVHEPIDGKPASTENISCGFGSFLVYRKLEQDVAGFNQKIKELACLLENKENDSSPETEELLGAMMVGRWPDGRPIALYGSQENPAVANQKINNFNYGSGNYFQNESALKCPFHAHVRLMNPRLQTGDRMVADNSYVNNKDMQEKIRIVRRGVPYGLPKSDRHIAILSESTQMSIDAYQKLCTSLDVSITEEGVLFLCFQNNINGQFRILQDYANVKDFRPEGSETTLVGLDPLIGQEEKESYQARQKWTKTWGEQGDILDFNFSGFVTPRGGEYFFAPSISFLKSL